LEQWTRGAVISYKQAGDDDGQVELMSSDAIKNSGFNRRAFLAGLPAFACLPFLGGCGSLGDYGSVNDAGHVIPPLEQVDPALLRTEVPWTGKERPGTIVVHVAQRRLYLVEQGGKALRYAVGVGRAEALNFRGSAVIGAKAEWPHWTPTEHMMSAMPRYRAFAGGMNGGIDNPLGARALYLYRDGQDTHFRLHGTTEPESIGKAVSSGCIRLFNHDIIDLYNRVPTGTSVIVIQS
jgi:lipoprotein-anchoring transpeptidase ErfK/SrfK